jgi:hypothetical protein
VNCADELDAAAHFTPQHDQLMSERRVLCFKSLLKGETNRVRKKERRDHSAPTRFSYLINTDQVFGTHIGGLHHHYCRI